MKIHHFKATKQTIDLIVMGILIHEVPRADIRGEIQKGDKLRLSDGDRFVYVKVCNVFESDGVRNMAINWIRGGLESIRKQEEAPEVLTVDGAESSSDFVCIECVHCGKGDEQELINAIHGLVCRDCLGL